MPRNYLDYLDDMIAAMNDAQRFVENMTLDQFLADKKTQYAVVKAIEIVGEATKKIPDEIKIQEPSLDWKSMSGARDVLSHGYFGIDYAMIWRIVAVHFPVDKERLITLKSRLTKL
ncbi:MAG: DUF86 domain-containing protein [Chloroherpetonaceae bacterium]|nr:DUF86 domain-containing protein [Chloroherpetonaceae bacterium]MDW8438427.1 DUF86 domain-containing protein [Chloroherpetonaceae bacterium]